MRTSNIEIIFDLNVYTRDHFSQRAQISNLKIQLFIVMSLAQFTVPFYH